MKNERFHPIDVQINFKKWTLLKLILEILNELQKIQRI